MTFLIFPCHIWNMSNKKILLIFIILRYDILRYDILSSLFQQFNSGYKLKGRCKNLQVYGLTETPTKFQTTSFQCQLASAHQKCEEIGGLSPYTCTLKFKIHSSVHGFLYRWQCEILRIKFLTKPSGSCSNFFHCKRQRNACTLGWNLRFGEHVYANRPTISAHFLMN
jgi:hypothetical protein